MEQKHTKRIGVFITALFVFVFGAFVIANTSDRLVFSDSDQDGMSDEEERVYGTDPNNKDTDGDGYSDGTEIKSGYDPLKPAPGDKLIPEQKTEQTVAQARNIENLTEKFYADVQSFMQTNEQKTVTTENIQTLVSQSLGASISPYISGQDIPEIDFSKIKIIEQDYKGLSDSEKLSKEKEAWEDYLSKLVFTFLVSASSEEPTPENFENILDELGSKTGQISANPDVKYFRDLASKMESFVSQAKEMEVPEKVLPLHIKFLRIVQGFLDLRDPSLPNIEDDNVTKIIILSKVKQLNDISSEFLESDVKDYNDKFKDLD